MLTPELRETYMGAVLRLIDCQPAYSVRQLAQEVHLSCGKLRRLFKQEIGGDIGDYMIEKRLQKAAQLLTTSELSIKEITDASDTSIIRASPARSSTASANRRSSTDSKAMVTALQCRTFR